MKFTIAPLLLSSVFVFASPDSKAAKLAKAKFPKMSKSYGGNMCMSASSMSMSVGPEPPITSSPTPQPTPQPVLPTPPPTPEPSPAPAYTLTACGESFINTKVVLADNLDCGPSPSDEEFPSDPWCAVMLSGPQAELNCNDYKLSQVATPQNDYEDGPYESGICLIKGAVARNCNVQQFHDGVRVIDGGEVRSSFLTSNYNGIFADFTEDDATVTIENT